MVIVGVFDQVFSCKFKVKCMFFPFAFYSLAWHLIEDGSLSYPAFVVPTLSISIHSTV